MPSRSSAQALASYAALAFLSFLPLSLDPFRRIGYVGDSLESVTIVAWNVHQFFRDPRQLFSANVLFPVPDALAFTDHRLLPSLLVAPVVWATGNAVLATNLATFGACAFAAMTARYAALRLGLHALGAWAAGALYGFHTYQINEGPRLNIVSHGFLPLALLTLAQFLKTGERRHAWRLAGWMLLQGLASNYHLLYAALLVALLLAGFAVRAPSLAARRLVALAPATCVAALLFAPIAWPYVRLSRAHALSRELPAGVDLRHYVSTAPGNLLYGQIGGEVRLQQRGPHFAGFVALGLAAIAVGAAIRKREVAEASLIPPRILVPACVALFVALVALSLGRDLDVFGAHLGPGPYRLLYDYVPGFQLVRIPERLALPAMLFLAILAGRGLTLVQHAAGSRVALALALLVPAEHLSILAVTETMPVGAERPAVYDWLAGDRGGALAELPVRGEGLVRQETVEMYFATRHWRPIVHGYTAYAPQVTRLLRRFAAEFPSEASLAGFARVGVDTVVVHRGRELAVDLGHQLPASAADRQALLARRMRLAELDLYDRLPVAVAAGAIREVARFEGPAARLFESSGDEVYRIVAAPKLDPAPFPSGQRLLRPTWRYRAKAGDPLAGADGDLRTAWSVPRPLRGDEFFEVLFDRPQAVSGVVLRLQRDSAIPSRFRIGARDAAGNWGEVARYDGRHALQLLERLLADPRQAAIGFVLSGREVTGLNLLVEEGGTSFEGWRLPELEVLGR